MNSHTPHVDTLTSAVGQKIAEVLARQPPGRSPLQGFYTDPDIYREDLDRFLMRHWFCVGHISSLAKSGDFLPQISRGNR